MTSQYIACTQGDETYVRGVLDGVTHLHPRDRFTIVGTYKKAELSNLLETHENFLYQANPQYHSLIKEIVKNFWSEGSKSSGRRAILLRSEMYDQEGHLEQTVK